MYNCVKCTISPGTGVTDVSCCPCASNWTQVFWKSSQWSSVLSHLSSPHALDFKSVLRKKNWSRIQKTTVKRGIWEGLKEELVKGYYTRKKVFFFFNFNLPQDFCSNKLLHGLLIWVNPIAMKWQMSQQNVRACVYTSACVHLAIVFLSKRGSLNVNWLAWK